MTPWLGLDRIGFLLIRFFMRLCTRATVLPTETDTLDIDPDKPVVYVFRDRSATDAAVVDLATQQLKLPPALQRQTIANAALRRSYFALYRRTMRNRRQRNIATPRRLTTLVDGLRHHPESDVQIVPVSIFWGRRPERESSLWRIIFSANWSQPGFIKKFLIIITQGKQLYVHVSRPMSLRTLVDQCDNQEQAERKALRILRVHFRRQHEAAIGPDLSHRRVLADSIIESKAVRQAIRRQASESGINVAKAEAQARKYIREIAADYSHTVIRALEVIFDWVWNRLYDGIRLYNMDKLNKVAKDYEVIYVPCHRSHIDYLLLSFVVYRNGLVPPHIAAGINLNLPVVGTILRRGGAFFMRRSFRDNPLYATVFSEYLHTMTARGYSIEYFVEGGRSRSGRMLQPRTGMLAMTVAGYLKQSPKPLVFVPVYFGYEKVMESGAYIGELHGRSKKKESVGGFFRSLSVLRSHFGQVHVSFGTPLPLNEYLDRHEPEWRNLPAEQSEQSDWFRPLIGELGVDIAKSINACAVANPINLISLAILASTKHTMDIQQLEQQLDLYIQLLKKAPYGSDISVANDDASAIIDYALTHGFIERVPHCLGDVVKTDEATALQMAYIRNNSVHLFILPGLICSLFHNARSIRLDQLQHMVALLYPFLRNEYFLHWQTETELADNVEEILAVLEETQLVARHDDCLHGAAINTPESDLLDHLGQTVMPSLERYYLTIRLLVQYGNNRLSKEELGELAHQTTQRLSLLYEFNSPEFFDKVVIRHFIEQLLSTNLVDESDTEKLTFDEALIALDDEASRILSPNISQAIQRVTRLKDAPSRCQGETPETPAERI